MKEWLKFIDKNSWKILAGIDYLWHVNHVYMVIVFYYSVNFFFDSIVIILGCYDILTTLVAIAVFRACGIMDILLNEIKSFVTFVGIDNRYTDALLTAFMKPLSGSGARSMIVDAMKTHCADSFTGRLASTFQGAADTTFYIIAVYFGSMAIRKTRHAVICGLIADFAGLSAAVFIAYLSGVDYEKSSE